MVASLFASYLAPKFALDDLKLSANVIDTSGRQRMYSQRILFLTSYLATQPDDADAYRSRLITTIDDMQTAQNTLSAFYKNNVETQLDDSPASVTVKAEFAALDQSVIDFTARAEDFASSPSISPSDPQFRSFVETNIDNKLARLDAAVQRYEVYALNQVQRVENIATFFLLLALIIIALEALLIFYPGHKTIMRFVHERTVYEKQLKTKNAELEHFTYIASHDLRAPIRGMSDLVKWIEEDTEQNKDPGLEQKFTLLKGRINRLDTLLSDMLSFAKIGKTEEPIEDINVAEIIDEIRDWIDPPEGFEIVILNALPTVRGPRSTLRQMFLNLISNGIKHHDQETGRIEVSYRDNGAMHVFDFSDDGPGIPGKFKEYIFQVFSRLKPRDEVEGSGIGLSIVKRMAESMDGRVMLVDKDAAARGTTMRLIFPKNIA